MLIDGDFFLEFRPNFRKSVVPSNISIQKEVIRYLFNIEVKTRKVKIFI